MSKVVVITGSTSGIGLGLAESFLQAGCSVLISGRTPQKLERATRQLESRFGSERAAGCACDVSQLKDVQKLWDFAIQKFGKIDIWINNAGTAHPQQNSWETDDALVRNIFDSNVHGLLNGMRVAVKGMQAQGGGQIYNLEGFGSNGRIRKGLGPYGASKAAVNFLNKTFALELAGSPVKVASVQPGMVKTALVIDQFKDDPEGLEKFKPVFNIIASTVDEVAPVLTQKMLSENKNGAHLEYLSRFGLMLRFLTAPFAKRDLFKENE